MPRFWLLLPQSSFPPPSPYVLLFFLKSKRKKEEHKKEELGTCHGFDELLIFWATEFLPRHTSNRGIPVKAKPLISLQSDTRHRATPRNHGFFCQCVPSALGGIVATGSQYGSKSPCRIRTGPWSLGYTAQVRPRRSHFCSTAPASREHGVSSAPC